MVLIKLIIIAISKYRAEVVLLLLFEAENSLFYVVISPFCLNNENELRMSQALIACAAINIDAW